MVEVTVTTVIVMKKLVGGEEIVEEAELEMEPLLIEAHRLTHRVLELEEQQLQSLLACAMPALFLMMHQ